VAATIIALLAGCGDDDSGSNPPPEGRSVIGTGSVDYSSIDVELVGFPAASMLVLRPLYWSPSDLSEDPQATVTQLSATTFHVEFLNLAAGNFLVVTARILLTVDDSVGDEVQGVVILCDNTGPIIVSPECAGECAPLCGTSGHTCDG